MRRSSQPSIVNQSNIPVQHVFRWINGWMANLDGYRHIEHITYRHPSFHVNERVLRYVDHIQDRRPAGERRVAVRNTQGQLAFIYLSANGGLNFHVNLEELADGEDPAQINQH